ncbi:ABC transporter permease [Paludibacterium yongneupense]|uniref:ABC transporter permease n=1 Tax=Paludibacterium yongneupense TaxID=400061 RepID=UPI000421317F|nr:ABC transporter permease [Paludibacterium yongneupense]
MSIASATIAQGLGHPQRVPAFLVAALSLSLAGLPLLSHAPNRLLTGHGISLISLLHGQRAALALPLLVLPLLPWLRPGRRGAGLTLLAVALALFSLLALAGSEAAHRVGPDTPFGRTSFGGGFWLAILLLGLLGAEAAARYAATTPRRTLLLSLLSLPAAWLVWSGQLDQTSILREYANRKEAFDDALLQHLQIVVLTVVPALLLGVPLGLAAFRRASLRRAIFSVLNLIQTVPSIALFGLLIAPLAALAARLPALGIAGVGMTPAVIALTLYALLPIARSTCAGMQLVPATAKEAAAGMGMTARQIFWRIELPLCLPSMLSGARVTAVQAIGLASVAALIGAGGFGALMFQGLLSSALDLVLLGVIPVVALAIVADALFKVGIAFLETSHA